MPQTAVFKQGNSVAVRLLGECKLAPGTLIKESKKGNVITLELVEQWSQTFLNALDTCSGMDIELPSQQTPKNRDLF